MSNMSIDFPSPGAYVLAVSGGVDSVVLLDVLAKRDDLSLVVAHFDHGIRDDSYKDLKFVAKLAEKYKLEFESEQAKLGPGTSEATAREARYKFLNKTKDRHQANGIITAHHQDDLIETAIINIIRGTGRKGLSSLSSNQSINRPFLTLTKADIIDYAKQKKLNWREDPTNTNTKYLRNYVRHVLVPKLSELPGWRDEFLQKLKAGSDLNKHIEASLDQIVKDNIKKTGGELKINQKWLLSLPGPVAREVIYRVLSKNNAIKDLDKHQIRRVWLFIKTAKSGKSFKLSKEARIGMQNGNVLVKTKTFSNK